MYPWRGGGHFGTKWIPTAKQPCGAEAVNTRIEGQTDTFKVNKVWRVGVGVLGVGGVNFKLET